MTTMISEVYEAFREANVSDERARAAAEAIAAYEARFAAIERRLVVLAWQIGALTAVVAGLGGPSLWLLLRIATKVGAVG